MAETTSRAAVIRPPAPQIVLEARGVRVKVLVSSEETGGHHTMLEYTSPPNGPGPPLHLHRQMEETFHVVEGELNFQIGDSRLVAAAGTVVHVPTNVPHAFWNTGPGPARMIVVASPGGLDQYFHGMFELANRGMAGNDIRPLIEKLGEAFDQIVVGPSPAIKTT